MTLAVEPLLIMVFSLLVMVITTGSLRTHGVPAGEKVDSSESTETAPMALVSVVFYKCHLIQMHDLI